MEKGYYKTTQVLVGYDERDVEHKDEKGNLLYTVHIKEPIYEKQKEYVAYTQDEILENLRYIRQNECFSVINRGILWYNLLTEEQQAELNTWYRQWLDITDIYKNAYERDVNFDINSIIPTKPSWL